LDYESHATGLDRNELGALLVAAGLGPPAEHALISLLGSNECAPAWRRIGPHRRRSHRPHASGHQATALPAKIRGEAFWHRDAVRPEGFFHGLFPPPGAVGLVTRTLQGAAMPTISVRRASAADRPMVERLWLMFRHDMSEFGGQLPNPDGTFRAERLAAAFQEQDWAGYVFAAAEDRPVGFAIVRGLADPVRVLSSFFVVWSMRRAGVGLQAAGAIVAQHPGRREVAFQEANAAATRFWRRAATELAGRDWTEEVRPVPGRPDLPPDAWISFTVGQAPHPSPRSTQPTQG
jgi:predicted acetyltransferase